MYNYKRETVEVVLEATTLLDNILFTDVTDNGHVSFMMKDDGELTIDTEKKEFLVTDIKDNKTYWALMGLASSRGYVVHDCISEKDWERLQEGK